MTERKDYKNLEKYKIKHNEEFLKLFGVKRLIGWKEKSDLFTKQDIATILMKNFLAKDLEEAIKKTEEILHETYHISQIGFDGRGYYSFGPMGKDEHGNSLYQLYKRFPSLQ